MDKVVNLDAINLVEQATGEVAKKAALLNSEVGKMAKYIISDTGKEIDNIIMSPIIPDYSFPPYTKSFNVEIILK